MNLLKKNFVKVLSVTLVFIFECGQVSALDEDVSGSGTGSRYNSSMTNSIEPFTVVVIPDTQIHTFSPAWSRGFVDQTNWIRENVALNNIAFVTHLGDVVQGEFSGLENLPSLGWQDQWERARAVIAQLDAINLLDCVVLPYSVSLGNHDLLPRGDKLNSGDSIPGGAFRKFFGAARYKPYRIGHDNPFQWYGGSDDTQWNHYQIFRAGPYTYLHINLELEPQDPANDLGIPRIVGINDALVWAQSVIDAHPGLPTIISSHKLITDLEGQNNLIGYRGDGVDEFFGGQRTPTAKILWERLVKGNPQVFMTINGHEHEGPYREDGEYHQVSTNDAGLSVFEILVNYQEYFNLLTANDPYLRLIEFDPQAGQIRNKTFSPTFARFDINPDAIETAFVEILDAFDSGMFLPILSGEELVSAIAPFPLFPGDVPHTREQAASVILDFFGASNIEELRSVSFSPYLTDADSQFSFDVGFNPVGRPTLAKVVPMNIHPFRCSDELYTKRNIPFVPVAILGSSELIAEQVDYSSLRLEGVAAYDLHFVRDVGTPGAPFIAANNTRDCDATERDGLDDLVVLFNRTQILQALGDVEDEQMLVLRLTGNIKAEFGGHPIVAKDMVVIKQPKLGQTTQLNEIINCEKRGRD